jgi:hypothetical protein
VIQIGATNGHKTLSRKLGESPVRFCRAFVRVSWFWLSGGNVFRVRLGNIAENFFEKLIEFLRVVSVDARWARCWIYLSSGVMDDFLLDGNPLTRVTPHLESRETASSTRASGGRGFLFQKVESERRADISRWLFQTSYTQTRLAEDSCTLTF